MTRFRHQPVAIIPASSVKAVNAELERHGYGPDNASISVVGKTSATNTQPTHYAFECPADDGFLAAIKLAVDGVPGVTLVENKRGEPQLDKELDKRNLKSRLTA